MSTQPTDSPEAAAGLSPQRLAVLPAELLEEITKRQAAAAAAVEFPHHDPAWIPATGALSARIVEAPDHPYYEYLVDLTLEQKAALPARFHLPAFDDCGVPNAWLCTVCWDEGTVTGWPCATVRKHGAEVFGQSREDVHRARLGSALAEAARLTRAVPPMPDQIRGERLAEIRDALGSVPAPPWCWIGVRNAGGPRLATAHSGRQYLLGAAKPTDQHGDELTDPVDDGPVYGDLQFRDQRKGEKYSTMRRGNVLSVGRRDYDSDTIIAVANPVAEWMQHSPQYVTDLLAELEKYVGHEPTVAEEMQYLRNENDRLLADVDRLQARVAELETARCHAGALAEQRHQLLDPPEPPLCIRPAVAPALAVTA